MVSQLAVCRRRSGLSQREIGLLMGARDGAKISRYEQGRRLPPLRTALAYATILDVPFPALFPNLQKEVQTEIARRIPKLHSELAKAQAKKRGATRAARMAEWLREHHESKKLNSSRS